MRTGNRRARTLPRPLSLSDFENLFFPCAARPMPPAPAAGRPFLFSTFFFLRYSLRRRLLALRRSRRRARGSMATAPGSKRAPLLHWWCRWFSDFALRPRGTERSTEIGPVNLYGWNSADSRRADQALKDQGKTALVYHAHWESPRANSPAASLALRFRKFIFSVRRAPNATRTGRRSAISF